MAEWSGQLLRPRLWVSMRVCVSVSMGVCAKGESLWRVQCVCVCERASQPCGVSVCDLCVRVLAPPLAALPSSLGSW